MQKLTLNQDPSQSISWHFQLVRNVVSDDNSGRRRLKHQSISTEAWMIRVSWHDRARRGAKPFYISSIQGTIKRICLSSRAINVAFISPKFNSAGTRATTRKQTVSQTQADIYCHKEAWPFSCHFCLCRSVEQRKITGNYRTKWGYKGNT